MTKIFSMLEDVEEIADKLVNLSQPVYLYKVDDGEGFLIASDVEIDDDDLEGVANELIEQYYEENGDDDDYDYTADDRNFDMMNGR